MGGLQLLVSAPIGFTVGPPDGKSNQQWKDGESRREEIKQIKQRDRQQHVNHAYRKNAPHGFIATRPDALAVCCSPSILAYLFAIGLLP